MESGLDKLDEICPGSLEFMHALVSGLGFDGLVDLGAATTASRGLGHLGLGSLVYSAAAAFAAAFTSAFGGGGLLDGSVVSGSGGGRGLLSGIRGKAACR